jgi:hypothetical protein
MNIHHLIQVISGDTQTDGQPEKRTDRQTGDLIRKANNQILGLNTGNVRIQDRWSKGVALLLFSRNTNPR